MPDIDMLNAPQVANAAAACAAISLSTSAAGCTCRTNPTEAPAHAVPHSRPAPPAC